MTVHVTHHAIDRYIERVRPVDRISAREAMLAAQRGIEAAAAFGAHVVRLPEGAGLIVRGLNPVRVVTVLAPGNRAGGKRAQLALPSERPRQ